VKAPLTFDNKEVAQHIADHFENIEDIVDQHSAYWT